MRKIRQPKPKKVAYELIDPESVQGHPMYGLLAELVSAYHEDLHRARMALAWCTSWMPDADGRVTLGKCRRASDLDRELATFDFVILLRRAFWLDARVNDAQRRALLDHELCHAQVKHDANGEVALDERGRVIYRSRKHDIEEFTEIVERHGTWKRDLEQFAQALHKAGVPVYTPCANCQEQPGWVTVIDAGGTRRLTRCECYVGWTQQLALRDSA